MEEFVAIPEDRVFDCVGLGLNAFDRILVVPHYPPADGKVAFEQLCESAGGQVASALAALSLWQLKTRYIGRIGDDDAGQRVKESLTRYGVDLTDIITVSGCRTQHAFIIAARRDHSRTIYWNRPAELTIKPEELDPSAINSGRILLLDCHDEDAAIHAAQYARTAGTPVVLDIEHVRPRTTELLRLADCVFGARRFAENFTKAAGLEEALRQIQDLGPKLVGATLGGQGCLACCRGQVYHAAACRVDTIDTTGAGDLFHAGIVYGLLQNWPVPQILAFANAAGALATTHLGVQSRLPTLDDVRALAQF